MLLLQNYELLHSLQSLLAIVVKLASNPFPQCDASGHAFIAQPQGSRCTPHCSAQLCCKTVQPCAPSLSHSSPNFRPSAIGRFLRVPCPVQAFRALALPGCLHRGGCLSGSVVATRRGSPGSLGADRRTPWVLWLSRCQRPVQSSCP